MSLKPPLTVPEAAERLNKSPKTIDRWRRKGRLPASQPGGPGSQWLIPAAAVEEIVNGTMSANREQDAAGAAPQLSTPTPGTKTSEFPPKVQERLPGPTPNWMQELAALRYPQH